MPSSGSSHHNLRPGIRVATATPSRVLQVPPLWPVRQLIRAVGRPDPDAPSPGPGIGSDIGSTVATADDDAPERIAAFCMDALHATA